MEPEIYDAIVIGSGQGGKPLASGSSTYGFQLLVTSARGEDAAHCQ